MYVLEKSFLWVLQASLVASVAAVLISLILNLFNDYIEIKFRNVLWIIVIIRLVIPIVPQSHLSLFNIISPKYHNTSIAQSDFFRQGQVFLKDKQNNNLKNIENGEENQGVFKEAIASNKGTTEGKVKKENLYSYIFKICSLIWLVGLFALAVIFLIATIKFKVKALGLKKVDDLKIQDLLEECKKKANITKNISIYYCDDFKSPCIVGIIKPKIYIPQYICNTEHYEQLNYILLHELIHYKKKDLIFNVLEFIAVMIHWFNPIIWFVLKKMKLDRECACDVCVLEILGEESAVEYGMTLINFSKMLSKKNKLQTAIFFETKSQMERRIKMIKKFKKGSYKMSVTAIICCTIVGSMVLTNPISAKNIKDAITVDTMSNDSIRKENTKFFIDPPMKVYNNMDKASEVAGFRFKLPDYLPEGLEPNNSYRIFKPSDKDISIKTHFEKERQQLEFMASTTDVSKFLIKEIEEVNKIGDKIPEELSVSGSEEPLNIAGISGVNFTLINKFATSQIVSKYFIWKDEGIWYAIEYYSAMCDSSLTEIPDKAISTQISLDNIGKLVLSMKLQEQIKNIDYNKKSFKSLDIYDKDDLKKAIDILGFNPKFPLKINNAVISYSGVSNYNNDKEKVYYLSAAYNQKDSSFGFSQSKISKEYEQIEKNGYILKELDAEKTKQIKPNTLKMNGKVVFKYEIDYMDNTEYEYVWKEDGFYCKASFDKKTDNMDKIVEEFVKAQPIQMEK